MATGFFNVPVPINEPVKGYAPGSKEKLELQQELARLKKLELDIPMHIGGQEVRTGDLRRMSPPHDHQRTLGHFHYGTASHVTQAIDAALAINEGSQPPHFLPGPIWAIFDQAAVDRAQWNVKPPYTGDNGLFFKADTVSFSLGSMLA